jgi:Leucine-rich repeat (LRR) protein
MVDVSGHTCKDTVCEVKTKLNLSNDGEYNFDLFGTDLKKISFSPNMISLIPKNMMDAMPNLIELQATEQGLTILDYSIFGGTIINGSNGITNEIKHLENIDLSRNTIKQIENNSFSRTSSLKTLDLSHNEISLIEANAFDGLKNLHDLILNNNQLTKLSDFKGMDNLNFIDLTTNKLTEINFDLFKTNKHIGKISLAHNQIIKIKAAETNWTVAELDVAHNNLSDISDLKYFDKLQTLNVSRNHGLVLKTNDFSMMKNLTSLNLAGIPLRNFSVKSFPTLPSLKRLNLSDNELEEIQDADLWSTKFPLLNMIDLTKNNFKCANLKNFQQLLKDTNLSYTTETADILYMGLACDQTKVTTSAPHTVTTNKPEPSTTKSTDSTPTTSTPTISTPTKSTPKPKPTNAPNGNGFMIVIWILLVILCILIFIFIGFQILKKRRENTVLSVVNPEEPVDEANNKQNTNTTDHIESLTSIVEESKQQTDEAAPVVCAVDETQKEEITTV